MEAEPLDNVYTISTKCILSELHWLPFDSAGRLQAGISKFNLEFELEEIRTETRDWSRNATCKRDEESQERKKRYLKM